MITERGPSARRGRQFSQEQAPKLLNALNKAAVTLRMIQGVGRASTSKSAEFQELRQLPKDDLEQLRLTTSNLLTDLRAELRRRGHF
jgi:ribosomal protein L29